MLMKLVVCRDPPGGSSDEGQGGQGGQGAARNPADDVCPWDSGPSALACPEQFGRTSRKNSSQLDSGGSSSDISIAIAEVTHIPQWAKIEKKRGIK